MAILTAVTGAVRANIAGFANKAISSGTDQIKSLAGLTREGANSSLATLSNLSKPGGGTSILTYPIEVDTDEQQGHYILFEINKRDEGKLAKNKNKKGIGQVTKNMADSMADMDSYQIPGSAGTVGDPLDYSGGKDPNRGIGNQALDFGGGPGPKIEASNLMDSANGKMNKSIVYEKLPTVRHHTTIALYMPPSLQVTYDVKYNDKEIGGLAAAFGDAIAAFAATPGNMTTKLQAAFDDSTTGFSELAQSFAMGSLDTFADGAQALMELNKGKVITPRMELMFEGVGRREFSYTFMFLPKSVQEARLVEEIIYNFKFFMMPEYSNSSTRREMKIPGTFNIRYMYRGKDNDFINKVSTCFLKNVQVEYGADRFTAHEETTSKFGSGAPPQKSKLSLTFAELETLSQDHIAAGH